MKTTRCAAAALLLAGIAAGSAQSQETFNYYGLTGTYARGTFTPKPGCCANAPQPTENLTIRRYEYSDGRVVIVYPYGNGTGYQPFWYEEQ